MYRRTRPSSDLDEPVHDLGNSEILEVLKGAHVFVTGATEFIGQVLVEKLLRTCEIDRLFLLVPPQQDKTEQECLEALFEGKLFERLIREQPFCLEKVMLVSGDYETQGLGLSEQNRAMLAKHVNFVFHTASNVPFDAKLWTAVTINISATKAMLDLAKEISHLKAFVYISTVYANCPQKYIREQFYATPFRWDELIQLVSSTDHNTLDIILPLIIGKWPNAYLFTKAVAEDMINNEGKGLPIGILRPSIVVNTAYEPVMGWINNIFGAAGVVAGAAEGLLKSLHCAKEKLADMVPADMCVNAAIAVAWQLVKDQTELKQNADDLPIFNQVSTTHNPITWEKFKQYNEIAINYPSSLSLWYYCLTLNKHHFVHNIYVFFLHLLPAMIMDLGARILGKKPIMWTAYQELHRFMNNIAYFTTQDWRFHDENLQALWKSLNPRDKKLFYFDISSLEWEVFLSYMLKGLKFYFGEQDFDRFDQNRKEYKRLQYLHYSIEYSVRLLLLYVFYRICLQVDTVLD